MPVTIIWFRHDLRLTDNPALLAGVERRGPLVPLFIWAPHEEEPWAPGAASQWWLHHSLVQLDRSLRELRSRLTILTGDSHEVLRRVSAETGADAVYWNRGYEPAGVQRDAQVEQSLARQGIEVRTFNSSLLWEPGQLATRQGEPFRVFTAMWKQALSQPEPAKPLAAPQQLASPRRWPAGTSVAKLGLLPTVDWADGLRTVWQPGEQGAYARLQAFRKHVLGSYHESRERPDCAGTSLLSPHMHWGEIGPRQIWHAIRKAIPGEIDPASSTGLGTFLRQLGWREFAHQLLYHFPHTHDEPLRSEFARFPWISDRSLAAAWQKGRTGYPIVDAGMRQLWHLGWMHNRVRMIVASFLVKDLQIDWREGARWFWDTLVDADLANNTLGWQWSAGCGADAAPYFRVFNPTIQARKFDPAGAYTRTWLPADQDTPARATIAPIVDHDEARKRALAAYASLKARRGSGPTR